MEREYVYWAFSSLLPSFLFFFFYLIILSSSSLSFHYICFFSITHCLIDFSSSLYFKAHCIYILTTLTSSSLFIVYVCEQQVSEKGRQRTRKKESVTLSSHSRKHLCMNQPSRRRWGYASSFNRSIDKDTSHSLLNGLWILLSITLNDSKFVSENMSIRNWKRTGLITTSNSRLSSSSNKGIRRVYIHTHDKEEKR